MNYLWLRLGLLDQQHQFTIQLGGLIANGINRQDGLLCQSSVVLRSPLLKEPSLGLIRECF
jgi:hypothetical protein